MKKQNLKKQIMKNIIIFIVILFLVTSILTSIILYKSSINEFTNQNNRFLTVLDQQISHFLIHPEEELKLIENTIEKTSKKGNIYDEVNFILKRFDYINRVEYIGKDGNIINTFPKDDSMIGFDYSRNPIYTIASKNNSKKIYYGTTFVDPIDEKITMPITIKTSKGNYLVGYLDLLTLKKSIKEIDFQSSIYTILDKKGSYIVYPEDSYVKERRINDIFNLIENDKVDNGDIVRHNNKLYTLQFKKVKSTGWTIIFYQELNKMLEPIYTTLIIFLFTFIFLILGVIFALNYNLNKINDVFLDFVTFTKKVSNGNYKIFVPNYPYYEFQELSNNFKNMIEEVEIREEEILKLNEQLENSYLDTIILLARTIEAKDTYTGNHCDRVQYYALMIGKELNLSKEKMKQLKSGSLLHDIGKLSIPESILTKPGKLTNEEYELIKKHPEFGYELIKDLPEMKLVKYIVKYHHEHYDGKGYPNQIKEKEIPLVARIVCIADAYDAMTSQRVYKNEPMTKKEAIKELRNCKWTQFDGDLVEAFVKALEENN